MLRLPEIRDGGTPSLPVVSLVASCRGFFDSSRFGFSHIKSGLYPIYISIMEAIIPFNHVSATGTEEVFRRYGANFTSTAERKAELSARTLES